MSFMFTALCLGCMMQSSNHSLQQQQAQIAAGKAHEECFRLAEGDTLRYSFAAEASLQFKIGYQEGERTEYPVPEQVVTHQMLQKLVASKAQNYCLSWQNSGAQPIRLQYRYAVDYLPQNPKKTAQIQ